MGFLWQGLARKSPRRGPESPRHLAWQGLVLSSWAEVWAQCAGGSCVFSSQQLKAERGGPAHVFHGDNVIVVEEPAHPL